jgi:MT0933-like antitoxin protein
MGFLDKAKDLLPQPVENNVVNNIENNIENNVDTVDAAIDKAGEFVDSKTEGKYKDTVSKVQEAAKNALTDGEKGEQQS